MYSTVQGRMLPRRLLLGLMCLLAGTVTASPAPRYSTPVSSLIPLLGLPQCLMDCSNELMLTVDELIANRISRELYEQTCSTYASTVSCLHSNASSKCTAHLSLFDDMTSGLQYACIEEAAAFHNFLPCVEATVTRRHQSIDCESTCRLNESISQMTSSIEVRASLLEGGGPVSLFPHSADLCKSLACYLKCSRKETNKYCGSSGSRLVEMVIRPFDRLVLHLQDATPMTHGILRDSLPQECHQFLAPKSLDDLRFDEDFLAKMRILLATRKRQEISSNYAENDRIIKKLLLPTVSENHHGRRPVPAEWDTVAVIYVIFMAFTMLLVVTGLIISVIWCSRSEEKQLASMRYFQPHLNKEQVRVIFKAGEQRVESTVFEEERVQEVRDGASSPSAAAAHSPSISHSRKRD